MLRMIKRLVFFRLGQKATKKVARGVGLRGFAPIAGLIGGFRMMRKH
jgi:hypothetical protein